MASLENPGLILTQTIEPEPLITLADAKVALEIDHGDRDSYIKFLIEAASETLDGPYGEIGKTIAPQQWVFSVASFGGRLNLPVMPAISIESVSYYDGDNASQSVDVSNFLLISGNGFAYIDALSGFSFPTTYARPDAISFTINCGMASVPKSLSQACRLLVAHWYENREAAADRDTNAVEFSYEALLRKHRRPMVGMHRYLGETE